MFLHFSVYSSWTDLTCNKYSGGLADWFEKQHDEQEGYDEQLSALVFCKMAWLLVMFSVVKICVLQDKFVR